MLAPSVTNRLASLAQLHYQRDNTRTMEKQARDDALIALKEEFATRFPDVAAFLDGVASLAIPEIAIERKVTADGVFTHIRPRYKHDHGWIIGFAWPGNLWDGQGARKDRVAVGFGGPCPFGMASCFSKPNPGSKDFCFDADGQERAIEGLTLWIQHVLEKTPALTPLDEPHAVRD